MKLKILTPDRLVLEEEVDAVYAKAMDGEIGILPKHVPLVTPLSVGVLRYTRSGQQSPVAVLGGILSTDGQSVTVLSDTAELSNEIDVARAKQAKERAEARLKQHTSDVDAARAQQALSRALVRLSIRK